MTGVLRGVLRSARTRSFAALHYSCPFSVELLTVCDGLTTVIEQKSGAELYGTLSRILPDC